MSQQWTGDDDGPSVGVSLAFVPVGATGLLIAFFVMRAHHPFLAALFALAVIFGAFLLVAWADRKVEHAVDEAREVEVR